MKATKPWNNRRFIGTFDVENTTKGDSGRYRCIVHSDKGVGVSNYGELTIKRKCRSPSIRQQEHQKKTTNTNKQQSRNAAMLSQRTPQPSPVGSSVTSMHRTGVQRRWAGIACMLFSPRWLKKREGKRPPQRGLLKIQALVLC